MSAAEILNLQTLEQARETLQRCCAADAWIEAMIERRPFANMTDLQSAADDAAKAMTRDDWLQAFSGHPRIGDVNSLREKFASTKAWASGEQAEVEHAAEEVLNELAAGNDAYVSKFGYIFIVCATGKSADEMLSLLKHRLPNPAETELQIAAAEQQKITWLRLLKLSS